MPVGQAASTRRERTAATQQLDAHSRRAAACCPSSPLSLRRMPGRMARRTSVAARTCLARVYASTRTLCAASSRFCTA